MKNNAIWQTYPGSVPGSRVPQQGQQQPQHSRVSSSSLQISSGAEHVSRSSSWLSVATVYDSPLSTVQRLRFPVHQRRRDTKVWRRRVLWWVGPWRREWDAQGTKWCVCLWSSFLFLPRPAMHPSMHRRNTTGLEIHLLSHPCVLTCLSHNNQSCLVINGNQNMNIY